MSIDKIINIYIRGGVKSFDSNRLFYYGIAILLVIFYHALCFGHSFIAFKIFKHGYIGVDIFLLFSGYGLCYSYEKSTLTKFYKKRLLRILPLFVIYAVFKSATFITIGKGTLSAWDWFCNVTTLSYYQIGGMFIDWYLCALLLLYITFPFFISIARYTRIMGLIAITIISYLTLMELDMSWTYQCLIGRLPIFYFGILLFDFTHQKDFDLKNIKIMLWLFLLWGVFSMFMGANKFLVTALVSPFLLFFCYLVLNKIKNEKLISAIHYLGSKSLEIYLGNCTALVLVRYIEETTMIEYLYYFVTTILSSIIYIKVNKILSVITS